METQAPYRSFITTQRIRSLAKAWNKEHPRSATWQFPSKHKHSQQERVEALSAFLWKNNVTASEVEMICKSALAEHSDIHARKRNLASVIVSIFTSCWFALTTDSIDPIASGAIAFTYGLTVYTVIQYPRRFNRWISLLMSDITIARANGIGLP